MYSTVIKVVGPCNTVLFNHDYKYKGPFDLCPEDEALCQLQCAVMGTRGEGITPEQWDVHVELTCNSVANRAHRIEMGDIGGALFYMGYMVTWTN